MGSWGNGGDLLKAALGLMLPRNLAEGLTFLGRVNSADADCHLLVGAWLAAAGSQGVTVGDGDDEAEEGGVRQEEAPASQSQSHQNMRLATSTVPAGSNVAHETPPNRCSARRYVAVIRSADSSS